MPQVLSLNLSPAISDHESRVKDFFGANVLTPKSGEVETL